MRYRGSKTAGDTDVAMAGGRGWALEGREWMDENKFSFTIRVQR